MSHLHIPDGIISPFWFIFGYILSGFIILICINYIKKRNEEDKIALLGVVGALMLLIMSIPLVFLPFHLSLTALAGIILGPYFGFLAAFIVNLILAFFGHGGITIVGLNTLIIGSEAILGWFLYNRFNKYMSKKISAGISALFALIISGLLMISIIGITNIDPDIVFHFLDDYAFSGILEHQGKSIFILALILMPLVSLGAIIEGIITYFVVGYINQVKPDILDK